tara:strand:- start:37 stop:330 length:294 start_codon:yes stop_codon:yes gene_type:complete
MSKFGDLISGKVPETVVEAPIPVVEKAPVPVVEEAPVPVVEVADIVAPPVETEVPLDYGTMSKDELEDYGRTIGIELDRRHNKKKLIKELEDYTKSI